MTERERWIEEYATIRGYLDQAQEACRVGDWPGVQRHAERARQVAAQAEGRVLRSGTAEGGGVIPKLFLWEGYCATTPPG